MQLSYLNEPSVLYNLQYRYNRDMIYVCSNFPNQVVVDFFLICYSYAFISYPLHLFQTKAGPVLVAVNPFKKVALYSNEYIEAYKRKSVESPHVYAITDMAIREMVRGTEVMYIQ